MPLRQSLFAWHDFHDPQLERWLQQVMLANNDLAAAALRVYRAQLMAQRVDIGTAPSVNATLNTGASTALSNSSPWNKNSSANLGVSYEVDLWGKLARQRDAAEWASQATQQDLQSARLALLANASKITGASVLSIKGSASVSKISLTPGRP